MMSLFVLVILVSMVTSQLNFENFTNINTEHNITFSYYKIVAVKTGIKCCIECAKYDNYVLAELRNYHNALNCKMYLVNANPSEIVTMRSNDEKMFWLKHRDFCPKGFTKSDAACL